MQRYLLRVTDRWTDGWQRQEDRPTHDSIYRASSAR